MAEKSTVARPYAQAVFELAKDEKNYAKWSEILSNLAMVTSQAEAQDFISSPKVNSNQVANTIAAILGEDLSADGQHLIHVLAENRRLDVASEIAEIYEVLRSEAESSLKAKLITALPVNDSQMDKVRQALEKRLNRKIELECVIEKSLIGGAVIKAGDLTIDGSALGRLNKLSIGLEG